jgi:hypothetical protein
LVVASADVVINNQYESKSVSSHRAGVDMNDAEVSGSNDNKRSDVSAPKLVDSTPRTTIIDENEITSHEQQQAIDANQPR